MPAPSPDRPAWRGLLFAALAVAIAGLVALTLERCSGGGAGAPERRGDGPPELATGSETTRRPGLPPPGAAVPGESVPGGSVSAPSAPNEAPTRRTPLTGGPGPDAAPDAPATDREPPALRGRLVDALGLPVSGAGVVVAPLHDTPRVRTGPEATSWRASSGPDGAYRVALDSAAGHRDAPAEGTPLIVMAGHRDFPNQSLAIDLPAPGPGASTDLGSSTLHAAAGLRVEVRGTDGGQAIAGAEVVVEPLLEDPFLPGAVRSLGRRSGRTDAAGAVLLFAPPPGTYRLVASAPGRAPAETVRTLGAAGAAEPVVLALPPEARLSGRVVDDELRAVEGAQVTAWCEARPESPPRRTRTLRDGAFLLEGLDAGPHRVRVEAPGHEILDRSGLEPSGGPHVLELAPGLALEGEVLDRRERAIAGAKVEVLAVDRSLTVRQAAARIAPVRTDERGRFRIRGLPGGRFELLVTSEGHPPARRGPLQPSTAGSSFVTVTLPDPATLIGRLTGPGTATDPPRTLIELLPPGHDGTPFQELLARVRTDAVPLPRARSRADGTFRLDGIPPGRWRLRMRPEPSAGGSAGSAGDSTEAAAFLHGADLELAEGEVRDLGDLALVAGRRVEGVATGPEGRPARGVRISADPAPGSAPGQLGASGVTDAEGRYRLGPLAPGRYLLTYHSPPHFRSDEGTTASPEAGAALAGSAGTPEPAAVTVTAGSGDSLRRPLIIR